MSTLDQITACAKTLSEPVLTYCQWEPKECVSVKYHLKFRSFHSRKCILKCHLQNGDYFVSTWIVKGLYCKLLYHWVYVNYSLLWISMINHFPEQDGVIYTSIKSLTNVLHHFIWHWTKNYLLSLPGTLEHFLVATSRFNQSYCNKMVFFSRILIKTST